jgi:hypothetical protein
LTSFVNDPNKLNPMIRLWPDGPPSSLPSVGLEITFGSPAAFGPETIMLRNVSDPGLTVFAPDPAKANGVGVIVCPGGAWRALAWEHEGMNPARWLASRGYTAFLLKYRVLGTPPDPGEFAEMVAKRFAGMPTVIPDAKAPRAVAAALPDESIPWAREIAAEDGRRAVDIVRERAAEWSIDPNRIGMVGFSAGAFLATDLAMDPRGAPLAFIAPIYGGGPRAASCRLTHRPCSQRSPRTTGCFSEWSRAFIPTGPAPIVRQSCTSSPAAATALASANAGCRWTAGPICSEIGWAIKGSPKSSASTT